MKENVDKFIKSLEFDSNNYAIQRSTETTIKSAKPKVNEKCKKSTIMKYYQLFQVHIDFLIYFFTMMKVCFLFSLSYELGILPILI